MVAAVRQNRDPHVEPKDGKRVDAKTGARGRPPMNSIIYLIGLIVVVLAVLSFFGLA
jgi:hypothetical protein